MPLLARLAANPFWSFGLPFTLIVLGGMYVLVEIHSAKYTAHAQFGHSRRARGQEPNSLAQDLEVARVRTVPTSRLGV